MNVIMPDMRSKSVPPTVILLVAALSAAACSKRADGPTGEDAAKAAALTEVNRLVQADLDIVPMQIDRLLADLGAVRKETSNQLRIRSAGDFVLLDWWLWNHGLTEFRGIDEYAEPLIGASRSGLAMSAKSASWYTATATLDPSSSCKRGQLGVFVSCALKIHYRPAPTEEGQIMVGVATPSPMTIMETVTWDGSTWTASPIDYGAAGNPTISVLNAILGPADGREADHQKYADNLARRAASSVDPDDDIPTMPGVPAEGATP